MRIGDALSLLARGGPASVRLSGAPGTSQERASAPAVPEVDVVQLTLHSDGIWQVVLSPQSDPSFTRTLHRPALPAPRFYPSGHAALCPSGSPAGKRSRTGRGARPLRVAAVLSVPSPCGSIGARLSSNACYRSVLSCSLSRGERELDCIRYSCNGHVGTHAVSQTSPGRAAALKLLITTLAPGWTSMTQSRCRSIIPSDGWKIPSSRPIWAMSRWRDIGSFLAMPWRTSGPSSAGRRPGSSTRPGDRASLRDPWYDYAQSIKSHSHRCMQEGVQRYGQFYATG